MNLWVWIILLLTIFFSVFYFLIGQALAQPYYELSSGWDHKPKYCVYEDRQVYNYIYKYSIIYSILAWEKELNGFTNSENFDIDLSFNVDESCDAVISFIYDENDITGFAQCSTTDRHCYISINMFYKNLGFMGSTIKHEVGHTLGLGHIMFEDKEELAYIVMSNDVMLFQAGKFR